MMNFDTPLVEYLIIGMHTSTWILFIYLKLLKLPITALSKIDPAIVILLLPFIYIAGMIFDDITFRFLSKRIKAIKKSIFGSEKYKVKYKDETIAFKSEVLYNAYEARVRRVKIIGAAILNWPLLGFSLLLNLGPKSPLIIPIIVSTIILTGLSWSIWHGLNKRAYEFRKKAIDAIMEEEIKD